MKYRIVEVTRDNHDPYYRLEQKFLLWWFDIAIIFSKRQALQALEELKQDKITTTERVLDE